MNNWLKEKFSNNQTELDNLKSVVLWLQTLLYKKIALFEDNLICNIKEDENNNRL